MRLPIPPLSRGGHSSRADVGVKNRGPLLALEPHQSEPDQPDRGRIQGPLPGSASKTRSFSNIHTLPGPVPARTMNGWRTPAEGSWPSSSSSRRTNDRNSSSAAFNTIGRHPDNTIQILDRIISKEHAHDPAAARRQLPASRSAARSTAPSSAAIASASCASMTATRSPWARPGSCSSTRPSDDLALNRVTIAPGLTESHIRQRIAASTGEFVPERQHRATNRCCGATTSACASATSWPARSAASSISRSSLPKILDKAFELVGADRGAILLHGRQRRAGPALRQDPRRPQRGPTSSCRKHRHRRGRQQQAPRCCRPTRPWTRASRARTRSSCRASARP